MILFIFFIFLVGIFITHNNDKDALPAVDIFKRNTNTGKRYWNTGFQITNMQLFWYNYETCFRLRKKSCAYILNGLFVGGLNVLVVVVVVIRVVTCIL